MDSNELTRAAVSDPLSVEWTEDERNMLETGVVCFGTNWNRILGKYGKHLDSNKTVEELRTQYYRAIEEKSLVQANLKHGVIVNEYGKPIYRNGEAMCFFCIDPLAVLRKVVEKNSKDYKDGDNIFVGAYFGHIGKMHRYAVSKIDGIIDVTAISTIANMKDKRMLLHEWKYAVEAYRRRNSYDLSLDDTLIEKERYLSTRSGHGIKKHR